MLDQSASSKETEPRAAVPAVAVGERMGELALEPSDSSEVAPEEWTALAERSGNLFSTREWSETWWRHFGESRPLLLTACREPGGRLAGVLPLYLASGRPVRTLRFLGHGPADQLGPVCDPADRTAVAAALQRGLKERLWPWDVFIAERLKGAEGWAALLGGRSLQQESSPVMTTGGLDWDAYLASRSSNFRQQVTRRERKLGGSTRSATGSPIGPPSRQTSSGSSSFTSCAGGSAHRLRGPAGGLPPRLRVASRSSADGCACGRSRSTARRWRPGTAFASAASRAITSRGAIPPGTATGRLRAAHAHDARGLQRRYARVPHAAWGRGLQGQVRQRGSQHRDVHARTRSRQSCVRDRRRGAQDHAGASETTSRTPRRMSDVLVICYHAVSERWTAPLSIRPQLLSASFNGCSTTATAARRSRRR